MPWSLRAPDRTVDLNDTSYDQTEALRCAIKKSGLNVKGVLFGIFSVVGTIPTACVLLARSSTIMRKYREELAVYRALRGAGINPFSGVGLIQRRSINNGTLTMAELESAMAYVSYRNRRATDLAAREFQYNYRPTIITTRANELVPDIEEISVHQESSERAQLVPRLHDSPPSYEAASRYSSLPVNERAPTPAPAYEEIDSSQGLQTSYQSSFPLIS